jgi:hypothetical protein
MMTKLPTEVAVGLAAGGAMAHILSLFRRGIGRHSRATKQAIRRTIVSGSAPSSFAWAGLAALQVVHRSWDMSMSAHGCEIMRKISEVVTRLTAASRATSSLLTWVGLAVIMLEFWRQDDIEYGMNALSRREVVHPAKKAGKFAMASRAALSFLTWMGIVAISVLESVKMDEAGWRNLGAQALPFLWVMAVGGIFLQGPVASEAKDEEVSPRDLGCDEEDVEQWSLSSHYSDAEEFEWEEDGTEPDSESTALLDEKTPADGEVDITHISCLPAMNSGAKTQNRRDLGYDSDSFWMAVDNCCSSCISNCIADFVGPLQTVIAGVKGISGTQVIATKKGVLRWRIADNEGRIHTFLLKDSYYHETSPYRLLSPQHLAQVCYDDERGTGASTFRDAVELHWDHNKFRRTIPLNESNIAIMRSAPGYDSFRVFASAVEELT